MTLALASAIGANDKELHVTGTVTDDVCPGYRFRLGDELLQIAGFGRGPTRNGGVSVPRWQVGRDRTHWLVARGQDRTLPTSHLSGVAVLGASDAYVSADTGVASPGAWASASGGGGGGGGGGAGELLKVERRVTAAEIKGALSAGYPGVQLVPGEPGVVLLPSAMAFVMRPGTTPYVNGTGLLIAWIYSDYYTLGAGAFPLADNTREVSWSVAGNQTTEDYGDYYEGQPISLWLDTAQTAGNGEIDVVVWYTRWALPA